MIPLAIELEGFLSFREPYRLVFEPGVTMLSGPNGSGKSTVFDGILVGLFGGSRLGNDLSVDLINAESDLARVAFEFQMGDGRYRVERTLTRKEGSYEQHAVLKSWDEAKGEYRPVKQGTKIVDCNKKLAEILGMSYAGFTTSVLLLQGKAETLLNQDAASAEVRFKALSAIVGLEFYAELHKRADQRRKDLDKEADRLRGQLQMVPEVTDEQIASAQQQIEQAQEAAATVAREIEHLDEVQKAAVQWLRLNSDLADALKKKEHHESLSADAEAIERDGRRLQDLVTVLPVLGNLFGQRDAGVQAEGKVLGLEDQAQKVGAAKKTAKDELDSIVERLKALANERNKDVIEKDDLTTQRSELQPATTTLKRLHEKRARLNETRGALASLAAELVGLEAEEKARKGESEAALIAAQEAATALSKAEQAVTRAKTELDGHIDRKSRFESVDGAGTCSWCGQKLAPGHAERERDEIARLLNEFQKAYDEAEANRQAKDIEKQKADGLVREADKFLAAATKKVNEHRTNQKLNLNQATGQEEDILKAWNELAPAWRDHVCPTVPDDWTATVYPTADDLMGLAQQFQKLANRLEELKSAEADRVKAEKALAARQKKLEPEVRQLEGQLQTIATAQAAERATARAARQQEGDWREQLPAAWRLQSDTMTRPEFEALQHDHNKLVENGAGPRWQELQQAIVGRNGLQKHIDEVRIKLGEVPEEHRRDPNEVGTELNTARGQEKEFLATLERRKVELGGLQQQREKRAELAAKSRDADRCHAVAKTLADLLGPRNLQRHLIHQAEVAIVANANRVLDHLTAGGLRLRLVPDDDNERKRALLLQVEKPDGRAYAIISGSERFRVAISLALGIGQYASRQHRRIETVIIDEGFGCLDDKNRGTMIEEIAGLIGELKCILLVSHLEDFAAAFPRGYRFSLENGASHVVPLNG